MGHHHHPHGADHGHEHDHDSHAHAGRSLRNAILLTFGFMAVEVVAGFRANSLALLSDAGHMVLDGTALALSWVALWFGAKGPSRKLTFGYGRVQVLGALLSVFMIWGLAAVLVREALGRFGAPPAVDAPIVIAVSFLGLGVNLLSLRALKHSSHSHLNVKAAYLHVMADSLGSVAGLISGAVLYFTGWYAMDVLVTLVIAALIFVSSWTLFRETVDLLLESTPPGVDPEGVFKALAALPGVTEVHDLHLWAITSGKAFVSVHLRTAQDRDALLKRARELLREKFGLTHATIQMEPVDASSEECVSCETPTF